MEIFVYADESGVFDQKHNDYFVFGGLIFLSKEEKESCARKYLHAERVVRNALHIPKEKEIKASGIPLKHKNSLFRSINSAQKFSVVVVQKNVLGRIFQSSKDKQRYLDYVFKIGVKRALENLIHNGDVNPNEVTALRFYVDEHTTATNGLYELREALEQEFRNGTYNYTWDKHFPPIFLNLKAVELQFCNSSKTTLVRAADIVANRVWRNAVKTDRWSISASNLYVIKQPDKKH